MIVVSDCEIWCWKQLPLFKLNMNYMAEKISSLDDISHGVEVKTCSAGAGWMEQSKQPL